MSRTLLGPEPAGSSAKEGRARRDRRLDHEWLACVPQKPACGSGQKTMPGDGRSQELAQRRKGWNRRRWIYGRG